MSPLNEYTCITCEHVTEKRRKINDAPLSVAKCEECSGMAELVKVSLPGYRRDHTIVGGNNE